MKFEQQNLIIHQYIQFDKLPNGYSKNWLEQFPYWILIEVSRQRMSLYKCWDHVAQFNISTSANGTGQFRDSNKTPLGWHEVAYKVGDGLPNGAVIKGRLYTGEIVRDNDRTDEDLITSRILWLKGLEPMKNLGGDVDTFERFIYIHGTNQRNKIGQATSAGCIRMRNENIIDIYQYITLGTPVLIAKNPPPKITLFG